MAECPCPCPPVKLMGCNLDSSIHYLSPRAQLKCQNVCRPSCHRCRPKPFVYRPGDGDRYGLCRDDPCFGGPSNKAPPQNPNAADSLAETDACCDPGFCIPRDSCMYPKRDYVQGNAAEATRGVPRVPHPRIALDRFGNTTDWCKSGYARNRIFGKYYARMPAYMCSVKERLAMEDYKLRCVLAREGRVCSDVGHNVMNQFGLLDILHSKNPLVHQSKLYIKPRIQVSTQPECDCCQMPHPCFRHC